MTADEGDDPGPVAGGNPADDEFSDRLERAAIRAELDTGRREPTDAAARSRIIVRLARMALGSTVLVAGLVMIVFPGPGWLTIAAGLAILSKDVAWADRLLRYIRRRVPGVPADGRIPRSALVTAAMLGLAGIAATLWWYTR